MSTLSATIQFRRGLLADLPAGAADGEPLWATDTEELYVSNGGSAVLVGGGGGGPSYSPPDVGDFTWLNQGTATATNVSGPDGIDMRDANHGGANGLASLIMAVPGSTWQLVMGYRPLCGIQAGYGLIGPVLYDSGSGKRIQYRFGGRENGGGNGIRLTLQRFSNSTTGDGETLSEVPMNEYQGADGACWIRVTEDGVDRKWYYGSSKTGPWVLAKSESVGTYVSTTDVGFSLNAFSSDAGAHIFHFDLS